MAGHMDSARRPILIVGLPEAGLLNPLLVLAGELARRGVDDLLFATDEHRRADIEALSAVTKVEFVSLGDVLPELSSASWDERTYRAVTQSSRFKALRSLLKNSYDPTLGADKYRRLEAAVNEHRPALMVIDVMCGYAIDLAITKQIPYMLSVPFLQSNILSAVLPFGKSYTPRDFPTPRSGLPYPMSLRQQLANRLFRLRTFLMFTEPSMSARLRRDRQLRAELGISPLARNPMAKVDNAERVLCYSLPELDYEFPVPRKVHLVGAMVPPLPQAEDGGEIGAWLDAQNSVIYQAFGTNTRLTSDEIAALVEVARRLAGRHQILWKLPVQQQQMLPPASELPPNLRIESWLPSQLDVLAHPNVTLFFNHAGGNAFHEGLYFGKPQVIKPLWGDCDDQALRGRDAGIGLLLDHPQTIDPDDVTDKLLRVLGDPAFRERAEHFATLERAAGGRHAAADTLLELPALTRTEKS